MHSKQQPSPPQVHRRLFLRSAGVALALPWLESMHCSTLAREAPAEPRRILAICNNLGLLPSRFFPTGDGRNYELSPYLQHLKAHRDQFTVLSGVSHPGVDGSHASDVSFLTAAQHPGSGGFRNSISLDQHIASKIGHETRFPSLTLGVNAKVGRRSLSWTAGGVMIPCQNSAAEIYKQLFIQGSESDMERQVRKLRLGQSIMDSLGEQARALQRQLGVRDRDRMDQFATAVRDVENRMLQSEEWVRTPKPNIQTPRPTDPDSQSAYLEKTRLMYQMARLAFETDSTRAITLLLDSTNSPTITVPGVEISDGYHNLSHHGNSEKKLQQLEAIDSAHMRLLAELMTQLSETNCSSGTLLDHSMLLYGSNFGDANKHTTDNMPMLLMGGGFRHGQHLAFDRQQNYPLPNLFVSMLQRFGFETDQFATATGSMRGLEPNS